MTGLLAQQEGRISFTLILRQLSAMQPRMQPQPDDIVPRFDFEAHLSALTGPTPRWPDSTCAVSQLRLSFKVQPTGLLSSLMSPSSDSSVSQLRLSFKVQPARVYCHGLQGPRTLHLDIVDYPGEWLLDLALLDKSLTQFA